jgi:tetratricopeptide (TPR) repeat protein
LFWPDNLKEAESELERAQKLAPDLPHTLEYLALTHVMLGKPLEALSDAQQAVRVDPLSPINRAVLAQMLYVNNRCNEALPILDRLSALKPPLHRVVIARGLCFANEGRWSEAEQAVHDQAMHGERHATSMLGFSLARIGRRNEALQIRTKLRDLAKTNPGALFDVAVVSYGLGDTDDAIMDIDKAKTIGPFPYELLGPVFGSLRLDSRFRSILRRRGIQLAPGVVLARTPGCAPSGVIGVGSVTLCR